MMILNSPHINSNIDARILHEYGSSVRFRYISSIVETYAGFRKILSSFSNIITPNPHLLSINWYEE